MVESQIAGQPISFFLQGGPGDINPYYAVTKAQDGAAKWRDWTGQQLGAEAVRVANAIKTAAAEDGSLAVSEEVLKFRLRWNPEKFKAALIKFLGPQGPEIYGARVTPEWTCSPRRFSSTRPSQL